MAYVAVKGGAEAIEASQRLVRFARLGTGAVLAAEAVRDGFGALVDQVMSEGSLYSPEIAALAIKQAEGSPEEAVFLLRAFRSTLPRIHYSRVIKTEEMRVQRRISSAFKDISGGQILGPSLDYSHRLLDFSLWNESVEAVRDTQDRYLKEKEGLTPVPSEPVPKVIDYIRDQGLLTARAPDDTPPKDVTKESLSFPTVRSERLQILTRGQTGAVIAFGYASLRGYGLMHPTVGELRVGLLAVEVGDPLGSDSAEDAYFVGEIMATEVESLVPVAVSRGSGEDEIEFDVGYGLVFGQNETKAIAMSILDQGFERPDVKYPTQDEEFVLLHIDSVEATGFISHLKLPHYVTFQSKLEAVRHVRSAK